MPRLRCRTAASLQVGFARGRPARLFPLRCLRRFDARIFSDFVTANEVIEYLGNRELRFQSRFMDKNLLSIGRIAQLLGTHVVAVQAAANRAHIAESLVLDDVPYFSRLAVQQLSVELAKTKDSK